MKKRVLGREVTETTFVQDKAPPSVRASRVPRSLLSYGGHAKSAALRRIGMGGSCSRWDCNVMVEETPLRDATQRSFLIQRPGVFLEAPSF